MKQEENDLKQLWSNDMPHSDTSASLAKVLKKASVTTGVKDIATLFLGWLWVLLMGFGASAYSAKRNFDLHANQDPQKNNN